MVVLSKWTQQHLESQCLIAARGLEPTASSFILEELASTPGPPGSQGEQGIQGIQGPAGEDGQDGTVDTSNFYNKAQVDFCS